MNRVLGWLLLLPAVVLGILQIVVPAARTVWISLFRTSVIDRSDESPQFLGLEAYAESELVGPVLLGLVVGLPAFLAAGLAGVAIGGLAAGAPTGLRLAVRGGLAVLLVLYAPVGIGLALRVAGRGDFGVTFLIFLLMLVVLPVGAGLVALVVMAAGSPDGVTSIGRRLAAAAVAVGLGLVTAVALGLQVFGLPAVVFGAPRGAVTPGSVIYQRGFQLLDLSAAAAVSTVLLGILAVLGVLATVVLLAVGLRVELMRAEPVEAHQARSTRIGFGVGALVTTLVVLATFLFLAREWVAGLFGPLPAAIEMTDATRILVNTWVPPLVATLVQVLVGALAGFGIGALRPLGRGSEWLLLLFAPGLLVGLTPLLTAKFAAAVDNGSFGESLVPPLLVSIPVLYLFTFVSAGLRRAWDADRLGRGRVVIAGAATVVLTFVVLWVVQAQTVTWNLIMSTDPDDFSGPLTLARLASTFARDVLPQQLATPVPLLAILCAFAAAATIGMDRLRLRVGRAAAPAPATGWGPPA